MVELGQPPVDQPQPPVLVVDHHVVRLHVPGVEVEVHVVVAVQVQAEVEEEQDVELQEEEVHLCMMPMLWQ